LNRALDIRRRHLGDDHIDVARALSNLGVALDRLGKYAEAEPLLRRALAIRCLRMLAATTSRDANASHLLLALVSFGDSPCQQVECQGDCGLDR
jgi:hypothetical protein